MLNEPITEEWLKEVGFKWHQIDRQPDKQWLLWIGDHTDSGDTQALGIELAQGTRGEFWFCWLRSDTSNRYSRFLHIRHMKVRGEVIRLIVALTDSDWRPENHFGGAAMTQKRADSIRADYNRIDKRITREGRPWRDIEKDDSRGGALPEHMQDSIDKGTAK